MSYSNILSRAISSLVGLGAVICVAVSLAGCAESLDENKVDDNVTLSLKLDKAFQNRAHVRVNHDGAQSDVWYYTVTRDFQAEGDSLLQAEIAAAVEADGHVLGNVGTNKSITIDSLAANTSYRVVAARILEDGNITGNVAVLVFKTLRNPDVFEKHPEWDIQYVGRQAEADNPDAETDVFSCTVGSSEDTYVACLLPKADFDGAYGKDRLRACFEDYVAFRNSENVKWPNVVVSGKSEHIEDRLRHGEYVLFMIGVTAEGELTGY